MSQQTRDLPSQALLLRLLRYEPDTGKLYWKERSPDLCRPGGLSPEHAANLFNSLWAGKEAFTASFRGYRTGAIHRRNFVAHRIIWKMVTGEDPPADLDHINGDRGDNRIANLRPATRTENMMNRALGRHNTSGAMGVYRSRNGHWYCQIKVEGRTIGLGTFRTKAEAIVARKKAERKYGYHPNHGRRGKRTAVEKRRACQ